jgi:two-component system sensor histidine kinase KdpD
MLVGLETVPRRLVAYRGTTFPEMDTPAVLARHSSVALVDELAHTNPPEARNKKRYQDIEELLKAGIDVYTTVNVQHIESLNDVVEEMTGVIVQETVPDVFFDEAFLKVIDIEAGELLERLRLGKIYQKEATSRALENFLYLKN